MDGDHQVALVGASASSLQLRCPRRRVLLPLGMHRSGTSLLTYLLHTLGATLPDEVVGPACGNPLGHWEPRNLVTINDEALRAIDRSWDDPRPIDPLSFNHQPRQQILARNTIWHQTAADDAANPDGEYQPWRGTAAFRSSTRCTRHIQPAKAKLPD
jgi:hypothetical protein